MDVYDFDKTLYLGDSSVDFFLYCIRRYPTILFDLPAIAWSMLLYAMRLRSKTRLKETFFRFVRRLKSTDSEVSAFWKERSDRFSGPCKPQPGDMVISASPEFLLAPICSQKGWKMIGSRVDPRNGRFDGENCYGEEKVRRFAEVYPGREINAFFSDSRSDLPLARYARHAFLVDRYEIREWHQDEAV